jgi:hypothetical protein
MPPFAALTVVDLETGRKELAEQFLDANFGCLRNVNSAVLEDLSAALSDGREEAIQKVFTAKSLPHSVCGRSVWSSRDLGLP